MAKSKEEKAAAMRLYRKNNLEKFQGYELKKNYGITKEEYDLMFTTQQGVCAICGNPERAVKNKSQTLRNLAVDHCHTTGKIRGLLCTHCNQGIGNFRDNPDFLTKAIEYLMARNN